MKNADLEQLKVTDWPLPDAYLTELGRIVALWGALESLINVCIGKLTGFDEVLDPKAFILVNHMSVPQKPDVLSTLCEQLAPQVPYLREYETVLALLRSAQRARNRFLHNGLALNPDSGRIELAEGSARGKLKVVSTPVDVADLRRAWHDIHTSQLALYKLVLRRELAPIWERGG